jgi:hypothetical protein
VRRLAAIVIGALFIVTQVSAQTRPRATNYMIPTDVQSVGGGDTAKSTKYVLDDTIGEANIGDSRSNNYDLNAGYRQTAQNVYITANCTDTVALPGINLVGKATGSGSCVVTTDNEAGYALSWRSGTDTRDGLVGYWRLDETAGTVAYDESGYGNNGTLTGGPTISSSVPTNYFSTRSVSFDGSDDYIDIGNLTPLDSLTNQVTISMWVYTSTPSQGAQKILLDHGSNEVIQIDIENGKLGFGINTSTFKRAQQNGTISANTWYHFVGVYDGVNVKTYLNGVFQNQTAQTGNISTSLGSSTSWQIGKWPGGAYNFLGNIDDVRIYNRALAPEEIQQPASKSPPGALVQSGSQVTNLLPFSYPATGGLMGYWKMDEIPAGTVADSSGKGKNGTPTGASGTNNTPQPSTTVPNPANFRDARSLSFDGTDDYVDFGDVGVAQPATLSMWINQTAQNSDQRLLGQLSGSAGQGGAIRIANSAIEVWDGSAWESVGGTITTGQWTHLLFTYGPGANGTVTLYINGVATGTTATSDFDFSGVSMGLGAKFLLAYGSTFNGYMDEVRLYDHVLTQAEITALAGTPQTWSVPSTTTAFGARVRSTSTDTDSKWGTDNSSEKWLHIGDGNYTVISRPTRTSVSGSTEIFQFRAEIGGNKIQQTGLYNGTVEITAATL